MLTWFKSWRERRAIKKLVGQAGSMLKSRYGFQEYYTPEQVGRTADIIGLDERGQAYAIAMYVQPENSVRILSDMRNASWAHELRKFLIAQCFGFSGGNDGRGDFNPFMHHPAVSHQHDGGFFDGSPGGHHHGGHSDGSGGGHSGGDSGGGHH